MYGLLAVLLMFVCAGLWKITETGSIAAFLCAWWAGSKAARQDDAGLMGVFLILAIMGTVAVIAEYLIQILF